MKGASELGAILERLVRDPKKEEMEGTGEGRREGEKDHLITKFSLHVESLRPHFLVASCEWRPPEHEESVLDLETTWASLYLQVSA